MGRSRGPVGSVATYATAAVFLCVLLSAKAESTGKQQGNEIHDRQHNSRQLLQNAVAEGALAEQDPTLSDDAVAPSSEEADGPSEDLDLDLPPIPDTEVEEVDDTPAPAPEVDDVVDEDTPAPAPEVDEVVDEDTPAPAPEVDEVVDEDTPAPAPEVDDVDEDAPAPAPEVDEVQEDGDTPAPSPSEIDIDLPAANPPEEDDDIEAPALAPAVITTRTVELEFNDLNFDEVNGNIEQRMELESRVISELAAAAGVDESDIEIVDFRRGSVIVEAQITFPEDQGDPDAFLDNLRANPESTLGEEFVSDFGVPDVTVDGEGLDVAASSISGGLAPGPLDIEDGGDESGPAPVDIGDGGDVPGLAPVEIEEEEDLAPAPVEVDFDDLAPGPVEIDFDEDGPGPAPLAFGEPDGPGPAPLDIEGDGPGPAPLDMDDVDGPGPSPLDFEPSPAPGSMGPTSEPNLITVELTFEELDFDNIPPTFEDSLTAQLAQGAGVDESDVQLELRNGSVIAIADITVPEDQDREDTANFVDRVQNEPGAVLGDTFTDNFGLPTVKVSTSSRVQEAIEEETINAEVVEEEIITPPDNGTQSPQMVGSLIVGVFMAFLML